MSDYEPVSCDLHSRYELWAMHRTRLRIRWQDGDATPTQIGTIDDLITRDGAEFLLLASADRQYAIRLDRILNCEEHR